MLVETAAELLAGFRRTRRELESLVAGLDEEALTTPLAPGGWSAREMMVHIAAWLHEAGERVPAIMAGAPARSYDRDAFNAAAVAGARGWTAAQALGAYKRAADRFESIAAELTDDVLAEEPDVRVWLQSAACLLITKHLDELARVARGRGA